MSMGRHRTSYRWDASNTEELRRIGEWLNAAYPIDEVSVGDRIISAANEIDRLRGGIAKVRARCLWDPDLQISDIIENLRDLIPGREVGMTDPEGME